MSPWSVHNLLIDIACHLLGKGLRELKKMAGRQTSSINAELTRLIQCRTPVHCTPTSDIRLPLVLWPHNV